MPTPARPGPHGRPLSPAELRTLAGIEDACATRDPRFAGRMRAREQFTAVRLPGRRTLLVTPVLIAIGCVLLGAPPGWWALFVLLLALSVALWLLTSVCEKYDRSAR